jgi:hypothetical protein
VIGRWVTIKNPLVILKQLNGCDGRKYEGGSTTL